jgi:hypothetical protein
MEWERRLNSRPLAVNHATTFIDVPQRASRAHLVSFVRRSQDLDIPRMVSMDEVAPAFPISELCEDPKSCSNGTRVS